MGLVSCWWCKSVR